MQSTTTHKEKLFNDYRRLMLEATSFGVLDASEGKRLREQASHILFEIRKLD